MKRLILEGFMGSGKTTLGRTLAGDFLLEFADTDREIEHAEGRSISRIFSEEGEEYFRDLETEYLRRLSVSDALKGGVIALGGGMVVRSENRELLKKCGTVVYLKASKELLKNRLRSRAEKRPLLKGEDIDLKVETLMKEREELYIDAADRILEIDGMEIYQAVNKLKAIYNSL